MKNLLIALTLLVSFTANASNINTHHRHKKCKGWGKQMLKAKHNWKSYVRYH